MLQGTTEYLMSRADTLDRVARELAEAGSLSVGYYQRRARDIRAQAEKMKSTPLRDLALAS